MKLKKNEVLVLKRCSFGSTSHNGFVYPEKGIVEALDWNDKNECGGGLHGWTLGFENYTDTSLLGNFIVIKVNKDDGYVELGDKVKFKKGIVIINTPDAQKAHELMLSVYPTMKLHWSTQTAGYGSTQTAGDGSTQTAGYNSVSIHRFVSNCSSIIKFASNSVGILFTDDGVPHVYTEFQNETVYFFDGKPHTKYTNTPDVVKKLKDHEIFVFGSNLNGNHAGGSAKLASDKFGAEDGVGEGLRGQSYAFPTLDKDMQKVSIDALKESVEKLIQCARDNTTKIFLLTKVGCGIAGFTEDEMKQVFNRRDIPANIIKPKGW